MGFLGVIFSFFTGWFARLLGSATLRFLAFKAILWLLFVSILPIVLYNVFSYIVGEFLDILATHLEDTGMQSVLLQLTGLAGYLGSLLKLPESFSVIMTACIFRATIAFIPFVGRM